LHPVLLDSALHAIGAGDFFSDSGRLPFSWANVSLTASGATALRVRIAPAGTDAVTLTLADSDGLAVAEVGAVVLRRLTAVAARGGYHESLFVPEWVPLRVVPAAGPDLSVETVRIAPAEAVSGVHEGVHAQLARVLDLLRTHDGGPLVVEVRPGDLLGAAVAGFVRSAQAEEPGRFTVVEAEESQAPSPELLAGVLA
ncbi:polyketide synthase dehydratase domain-containing protein, partial [Streptomyces californicus]